MPCRLRLPACGTGEPVSQHHLGDAKAIDHRDGDLISAGPAIGERSPREVERQFGTQRFICRQRLLRRGWMTGHHERQRWQPADIERSSVSSA